MMKTLRSSLAIATACGCLAACGGGSSDNNVGSTPPTGAAPQDVIARGPIANFGSIVVNGVRYDTSAATFDLDGASGSEADLRVGHIVTVKGSINSDGSRSAERVYYDDILTGPVQSVDELGQTLSVLGQTVVVTESTSFDDGFSPASLAGIAVGQVVEVSGQFDADGSILATRIEPESPNETWEIQGFVANLDEVAMTFEINTLVIDYSSAMLDDFDDGPLENGVLVEVEGRELNPDGALIAIEVDRESPFDDIDDDIDDDDYVELEGLITRFASAEDFDVDGQPVTTNAATEFENGDASALGLNVQVEVEGFFDANGVLVADEVEFRRNKNVRIEATVDAVDAEAGTVTLLGIVVTVDMLTRMEDKSDADLSPLNVADIAVGDYLEIRGSEFPADSGQVLAARLEREDFDDETTLQGRVESINAPDFTILGVTIQTNAQTEFEDESERPVPSADFFASLSIGEVVKAEGVEVAEMAILAEEVEQEEQDDD